MWANSWGLALDPVTCMEECEQTEGCMSFSWIDNVLGCWLKERCVEPAETESNSSNYRRTYYRQSCGATTTSPTTTAAPVTTPVCDCANQCASTSDRRRRAAPAEVVSHN
eukprot:TRINITY_DN12266_c0_g2_i10.p6 TRINITY_DN12266_c0_g2~~TRINITY_DN12266_c0_g2_i10.p6  ORF type:complete len:110 (+),score=16.66 TRINITY_DN12266_c0_g2_i10:3004-3333(+)